LAERYHNDDKEVIRTGELLLNREETLVDADGQRRWVRTTKVPLHDAAGKVTGLICIGRDITARRQAEESFAIERDLLRTLIDNLPDLIYVKDTQSRFLIGNEAIVRHMGAKSPTELLGKTDTEFYSRVLAERYLGDEKNIIGTGKAIISKEEPTADAAGNARWLSTTKVPLRDPQGRIIGIVGARSPGRSQGKNGASNAAISNTMPTAIENGAP
jgi:PAS domain S-box-containing protein